MTNAASALSEKKPPLVQWLASAYYYHNVAKKSLHEVTSNHFTQWL
jgi:hypothetical protein